MRIPNQIKQAFFIGGSVVGLAVLTACSAAAPAAQPTPAQPNAPVLPSTSPAPEPPGPVPSPTGPPAQPIRPTAPGYEGNRPLAPVPAPGGEMHESINEANLEFGFDLFAMLQSKSEGENVFISPLSVSIALAMAYNGASGDTRAAMLDGLRASGIDENQFNQSFGELIDALEDIDPGVELAIANSLWAREGFDFKQPFLETNRHFFDAELSTRDFDDPATVGAINAWVDVNTKGKINQILDKINPDDVMFIINAIYFNGSWSVEFEEKDTRDMPFHLSDGSEVSHPMMSRFGQFTYMNDDGFQAVRLPYGDNQQVAMYVFLPDEGQALESFSDGLDDAKWSEMMGKFRRSSGSVTLPRFEMEYEADLNDVLKQMGMGLAFDPTLADFSNLTGAQVFISKVKHKAVVEVNEEGTEAAAVTSIGVTVTSAMPETEPFSFIADRPFFFAIHDGESDSILFMGNLFTP